MDPRSVKEGLRVAEFRGLATYPARGTIPAPVILENAHLLPNGYACAPKATLKLAGVTNALYAGKSNHLFVQTSSGVSYYDGASSTLVDALGSLTGGVTLGPGLAQTSSGFVYANGVSALRTMPTTIPFWDGTGTAPSGVYWRYVSGGTAGTAGTRAFLQAIRQGVYPFGEGRWVSTFEYGPSSPNPPPGGLAAWDVQVFNLTFAVNVWLEYLAPAWTYTGTNINTANNTVQTVLSIRDRNGPVLNAHVTDSTEFTPEGAEYHNGRVWGFGGSFTRVDTFEGSGTFRAVTTEVNPPSRLRFSDIVYAFDGAVGARPAPYWPTENFIDIPFKVSNKIVAVKAAGRYLYVFGDREVLVLLGDAANLTIESLGDSQGAIAAASVQKLGQNVIFLSDSGVSVVSGGSVQDVSEDVRDIVQALASSSLSSTVDFDRETYLLSDGTVTLVSHARSGGQWTTRAVDGADQRLCYGGGTPYSVHDGALFDLGSRTADLLTMRVAWPPMELGDWLTRKGVRALAVGVDSDASGTVTEALVLRDTDALTGAVSADTTQLGLSRAFGAGVTPIVFSVLRTGRQLTPDVTVTPASGARRCVLRAPLQVMLSGVTEAGA